MSSTRCDGEGRCWCGAVLESCLVSLSGCVYFAAAAMVERVERWRLVASNSSYPPFPEPPAAYRPPGFHKMTASRNAHFVWAMALSRGHNFGSLTQPNRWTIANSTVPEQIDVWRKLGKLPKLPKRRWSDSNRSFKRGRRGWRSSGPQQFHPLWRMAPRMFHLPSQQTSLRRNQLRAGDTSRFDGRHTTTIVRGSSHSPACCSFRAQQDSAPEELEVRQAGSSGRPFRHDCRAREASS